MSIESGTPSLSASGTVTVQLTLTLKESLIVIVPIGCFGPLTVTVTLYVPFEIPDGTVVVIPEKVYESLLLSQPLGKVISLGPDTITGLFAEYETVKIPPSASKLSRLR